MIQANELRIGNHIRGLAMGSVHTVSLHFFNELLDDDTMSDWYSPIPLTSEILEKCGFIKDHDTYKKLNSNLSYLFRISYTGVGWFSMNAIANIPALYLHQLQNLYFALTGEELNYKP